MNVSSGFGDNIFHYFCFANNILRVFPCRLQSWHPLVQRYFSQLPFVEILLCPLEFHHIFLNVVKLIWQQKISKFINNWILSCNSLLRNWQGIVLRWNAPSPCKLSHWQLNQAKWKIHPLVRCLREKFWSEHIKLGRHSFIKISKITQDWPVIH